MYVGGGGFFLTDPFLSFRQVVKCTLRDTWRACDLVIKMMMGLVLSTFYASWVVVSTEQWKTLLSCVTSSVILDLPSLRLLFLAALSFFSLASFFSPLLFSFHHHHFLHRHYCRFPLFYQCFPHFCCRWTQF